MIIFSWFYTLFTHFITRKGIKSLGYMRFLGVKKNEKASVRRSEKKGQLWKRFQKDKKWRLVLNLIFGKLYVVRKQEIWLHRFSDDFNFEKR